MTSNFLPITPELQSFILPESIALLKQGAQGLELWLQLRVGYFPAEHATTTNDVTVILRKGTSELTYHPKDEPSNVHPGKQLLLNIPVPDEYRGADIIVRQARTVETTPAGEPPFLEFIPHNVWELKENSPIMTRLLLHFNTSMHTI